MGEVTILVLSVLSLGTFGVAGHFYNQWQRDARWKREQLAVEREWDAQAVGKELGIPWGASIRANILPYILAIKYERDELIRQKQSLTQPQSGMQDVRKPLTSAQARLRVDLDNRKHFSADKYIPNSELLKENSNG